MVSICLDGSTFVAEADNLMSTISIKNLDRVIKLNNYQYAKTKLEICSGKLKGTD